MDNETLIEWYDGKHNKKKFKIIKIEKGNIEGIEIFNDFILTLKRVE